jgi:hypothetical protein
MQQRQAGVMWLLACCLFWFPALYSHAAAALPLSWAHQIIAGHEPPTSGQAEPHCGRSTNSKSWQMAVEHSVLGYWGAVPIAERLAAWPRWHHSGIVVHTILQHMTASAAAAAAAASAAG